MQAIKFTQNITLSVDIEANVPDDWSNEDIEEFAENLGTEIVVNEADPAYEVYDGVTIDNIVLDSAVIRSAYVEGLS